MTAATLGYGDQLKSDIYRGQPKCFRFSFV